MKNSDINEDSIIGPGFADFSGIWSKNEAEEIEQLIAESCETIHPDDWK